MSSLRRSQKLSLNDLLVFLNISLKLKKSSDKVKTKIINKVNVNVVVKIIIKIIIKTNTADVVIKINYFRNFKKHIINNFKAAKKTREIYIVKLQRRTKTADHVKA